MDGVAARLHLEHGHAVFIGFGHHALAVRAELHCRTLDGIAFFICDKHALGTGIVRHNVLLGAVACRDACRAGSVDTLTAVRAGRY